MSLLNGIRWIAGAFTGTLNWTPTANQTITLPNATGTVLLDTTTVPLSEPRSTTLRLGTGSGITSTSGGSWASIGSGAGNRVTTGFEFVAVGADAGAYATTGSKWTGVGYFAGGYNQNGQNWTAIGAYALNNSVSGSNNTAIGANAGGGIQTGQGNTIVGANIGGLPAALTNNVILGSGDGVIKFQIDASGKTSVSSFIATSTTISTSTTTGSIQTTGVGIGGGRGSFSLATSYDDSSAASQINRSLYFNNGNTWTKRGDGSNVALSPLSLAAPVAAANVLTIPFDGVRTVLNQYDVIAPVTLTPATSRIQGATTIIVVAADGTNIPTLASGVRLFIDSATYSNVSGVLHVYTFYELSGTVWVRISR